MSESATVQPRGDAELVHRDDYLLNRLPIRFRMINESESCVLESVVDMPGPLTRHIYVTLNLR